MPVLAALTGNARSESRTWAATTAGFTGSTAVTVAAGKERLESKVLDIMDRTESQLKVLRDILNERVDRLVQQVAAQQGQRSPVLDEIVQLVDAKLVDNRKAAG
jgi:hypothetical protein